MPAGSVIRHVTLHLMREELPHAGLALAKLDAFMPDDRPLLADQMPEVPGEAFRDRLHHADGDLRRVLQLHADALEQSPLPPAKPIQQLQREQVVECAEWIASAWNQCAPFELARVNLREELRELNHLDKSLDELAGLDIDLEKFQEGHNYLDLLIGIMPGSNIKGLRSVLALSGHLILSEARENELSRVIIVGPKREEKELDEVLKAAGFHPLSIPETFRSSPETVRRQLSRKREELISRQQKLEQSAQDWLRENAAKLAEIRFILDAASPYADIGDAARSRGALAVIQGWLPVDSLPKAEKLLQQHLRYPYLLEARLPRKDELRLAPVPPAGGKWLRPFAALVRQYGVPRFGEIDPTRLFAFSFAGLFGMMFGDVGHGALFFLFGLIMYRRLHGFAPLFITAGGMATLFGFVYGSVFGDEHILQPLWMSPMSDPILMLKIALGWGIFFLSLGTLLATINRLLAGDQIGALFDPGGLFSLVFYLSLLGGLWSMANGEGFGIAPLLILLLSLGLVAARLWNRSGAPYGERAITVLIETFELFTGYITGSLSFLRVAAFSLNHVALSLAVFTLADMMSGAGHWTMLVFGNLFILLLEGMIVAIQTLRLEYYEGFSRFFYGDGRPFRPLRLKLSGRYPTTD